ncbi:hypothetical protein CsSME_00024261 [Camellia sinensis var. sinensis]
MFSYSTAGGAANQGALGPFGLLVLADESLSEQTPIYFYVAKGAEGKLKTFFCADESRFLGNNKLAGTLPAQMSTSLLNINLVANNFTMESSNNR